MVRTRTNKLNRSTQSINNKRDSSPERSSPAPDDHWLIVVTAKDEHSSRQVRVRESSIPSEIKKAIATADMAINIEDQLLEENDAFTNDERKQLLGFLKAIGFKMNDDYPSDCASYPHLESLHGNSDGFVWEGAKIKGSVSYTVNFTSDEHMLRYSKKETSQFLDWFKEPNEDQRGEKEAWTQEFLAYLGIKK
jgi:hypothetical protein